MIRLTTGHVAMVETDPDLGSFVHICGSVPGGAKTACFQRCASGRYGSMLAIRCGWEAPCRQSHRGRKQGRTAR